MTIVAAFLLPGSPLLLLKPDNPPWQELVKAYEHVGHALAKATPDVIVMYSTQWIAVLDQLWQTRPVLNGLHVDENWHEYGQLNYDITIDTALAHACVAASPAIGISSRAVNYDGFPIDSGAIIATHYLLKEQKIPVVLAANNLYHNASMTEQLGKLAVSTARAQGKRVAVVGVGDLSGSIFGQEIDLKQDHVSKPGDDDWNRKILGLIERGETEQLREQLPAYVKEAHVDMGFKHFHWVLGALDGQFSRAHIHAYGPAYGCGTAVIEFAL